MLMNEDDFNEYMVLPEKKKKIIIKQSQILREFYSKLECSIQDLNPQFSKLVDKHFWKLV
jgi:hypothetical protein